MKKLLLKIRLWKDWRKRISGRIVVDYVRECGYFAVPKIGDTQVFKLQSGKSGIYKLVDIKYYSDPHDMIKYAAFQFVGYAGQKPFSEMLFKEYCNSRLLKIEV